MLRIKCPWCGERDQTEFQFGGQADLERPADPEQASDSDWGNYLFYRDNPKGLHRERWVHRWGCRQWFNVVRDTLTHETHRVCAMGEPLEDDLCGKGPDAVTAGPMKKSPE